MMEKIKSKKFKLKVIVTLVLFCTVNLVYTQSPEITRFKSQRTRLQNLIRAYQDTLSDLNFIIAELQSGNPIDYSQYSHHREYQVKVEEVKKEKEQSKVDNRKLNNQKKLSNSSFKKQPSNEQQTVSKGKASSNSYLPVRSQSKIRNTRSKRRVGAICRDGTRSYATGRGACSHHGGVRYWLTE